MRRTPRSGFAGARRGLVVTLIVAATYAGPVAAEAHGPATAGTVDAGDAKTAAAAAASEPGVARETLAGQTADPPPQPTAEQRAAAGVPDEPLGGARLEARADSGRRHVVLVEDQHTLDAAIGRSASRRPTFGTRRCSGSLPSSSPAQAAQLRAMPAVTTVEPDGVVQALADQIDPPWGLDRIDQRNTAARLASYTYTATGAGVTAYVIDTGLWMSHTEFTGRTAPGSLLGR